MSRKIQVVVPDPIAKEVEAVVEAERFSDQSEFMRHLIRDYLNKRNGEFKAPGGIWDTDILGGGSACGTAQIPE